MTYQLLLYNRKLPWTFMRCFCIATRLHFYTWIHRFSFKKFFCAEGWRFLGWGTGRQGTDALLQEHWPPPHRLLQGKKHLLDLLAPYTSTEQHICLKPEPNRRPWQNWALHCTPCSPPGEKSREGIKHKWQVSNVMLNTWLEGIPMTAILYTDKEYKYIVYNKIISINIY